MMNDMKHWDWIKIGFLFGGLALGLLVNYIGG
jgi:hypothetical protein